MLTASRASRATSSAANNSGKNSQPSRLKSSICCWLSFMEVPPVFFTAEAQTFVRANNSTGAGVCQSEATHGDHDVPSTGRQELQYDPAEFLRRLIEHP